MVCKKNWWNKQIDEAIMLNKKRVIKDYVQAEKERPQKKIRSDSGIITKTLNIMQVK